MNYFVEIFVMLLLFFNFALFIAKGFELIETAYFENKLNIKIAINFAFYGILCIALVLLLPNIVS